MQDNGRTTPAEHWQLQLYRRSLKKKTTVKALLDHLPPVQGRRCLELGCGTGLTSHFLRQQGGTWTSCDFERDHVRSARGLMIAVVDELVPAGRAPFEDVEIRVRGDVLDARSHDAALAVARRAMAGARDLRAAARSAGREVESSGDLAPGQSQPAWGGDSPELRAALFGADVPVGLRGVVAVPAGALAYEVTRRVPFDPAAFTSAKAGLRDELRQQRQSSLVRSLVEQLRQKREIVINEPLVQQLDGRT